MKPYFKFGRVQIEKPQGPDLANEIAAMQSPVADPAQLEALMQEAAPRGYMPELDAAPVGGAAPVAQEFSPPAASDYSSLYGDYADAGLIAGLGSEFGANTGTAKELVKMRIMQQQQADERAREDAYKQELMSPTSGTALRQQEYLRRLGVDASGLGANDINALNAAQFANSSLLAQRNNEADMAQKQYEAAVRLKIAEMRRRKGGGGSGRGMLTGPDGAPMTPEQYDKWVLDVAGGNPTTAAYYKAHPKALDKAIPAYNTRAESDRQKRLQDAEEQRKNIAGAVQDYSKAMDFYNSNIGPINKGLEILDKYEGKDLPGVGMMDARLKDWGLPRLKENLGISSEQDRDALDLDKASMQVKQMGQKLVTGLGVSLPEQFENAVIYALDKNASEQERIAALRNAAHMLNEAKKNLDAGFGPQVVDAYEGNRARTAGKIVVRNKKTGKRSMYPRSKEQVLRSAPGFSDEFEILGSGY